MGDPDIILVDDDEDIRLSLSQTLELAGNEVLAFARAERIGPNFEGVVMSDIKMPGMDGLAPLDAVLGVDMTMPVVMITGHGDVPSPSKPSARAPSTSPRNPLPRID